MARTYTQRVELICEICGKTVMLPPSIIAQGRRRCSAKCMTAAYAQPAKYTCIGCGKVGTASPSVAAKRKYCSLECRRANTKARIVCEVCGTTRPVTPTNLKQNARFCSQKCAQQVLNAQQALNAPRSIVVCQQCGKESRVPPSRVRQGMRFCSHSCSSIHTVLNMPKSSTTIEVILYETLTALGLSFVRQHPICEARTVPDAYIAEGKIVLYADGDYWHALPKTAARDKRQNTRLAELGYTILRFTELELRRDPVTVVRAALGL